MRILIVTSQFPIAGEPNRGRPVYQTVRELSRLAEVKVLSPIATYPRWAQPRSYLYRAADADADAGHVAPGCDVEYVRYPALPAVSRPFNGHLCAQALSRPVRAFAPDVVLAYWLYPDGFGAMRAARAAGVPFVAGARGSDLRVRDAISRHLTQPVVRAAQRLLVVSEDLGRVAVSQYGADPERIRAIPNGCDAALFHPGDRRAAREALGLPQDAEVVLYVGRLVAEKGLRELLHATRCLAATRPAARVVFVGDGPLQAELAAALVAEPGLPLHLAGSQAPAQVAQWMVASDLVTLPSYSEGHPNVLVEALACGRPVVATPVGGIPEVVDAASGLLIPARDADALADALAQALDRDWDEAALARRFSRDWHQVARDTLLACEEAVAGTRTARTAYAADSA